jgi:hypothetical protein
MKIYKYKNYAEYRKYQIEANKRKSKNVWAKEENIKAIAEFIKQRNPEYGMCHGVRQGHEVIWFKKYLNCTIIGTEIGDIKYRNIIQWDFNKESQLWIGKFDFIYSNSFDHAYNPQETINIWKNQLKPNGLLILEYDRRQEHTGEISKGINKTDPVSIKFKELQKLIPEWTGMKLIKILDMPVITQEWRKAIVYEKIT